MKKYLCVLISVLIVCTCSMACTNVSARDNALKTGRNVVELYANGVGGKAGSAVVVDKVGGEYYALTCFHVVESAVSLTVKVGQVEGTARTVCSDEYMDMAVIAVTINAEFRPLEWGGKISVTDEVYSIGNALSGGIAYGKGIVSDVERIVKIGEYFRPVIMTTAQSNPGVSGGALVGMSGFVGLMCAKNTYHGGETVQDINYVIPADILHVFYDLAVKGNVSVSKAKFVSRNEISMLGCTIEYPSMTVTQSIEGSVLSEGDVIVGLGKYKQGDSATTLVAESYRADKLTVMRQGKRLELKPFSL